MSTYIKIYVAIIILFLPSRILVQLSIEIQIGKLKLRIIVGHHWLPIKFPSMQSHLRSGSTVDVCIFQEHLQQRKFASDIICYHTKDPQNSNIRSRCNTRLTFPTPVTGGPLGSGRGITTFTRLPDQKVIFLVISA